MEYAVFGKQPQFPLKKAVVTLTRCSVRTMDADNCRSSFKPVLDALVKVKVLADDSFDVIGEPKVVQEKVRLNAGKIKVRVEEAT